MRIEIVNRIRPMHGKYRSVPMHLSQTDLEIEFQKQIEPKIRAPHVKKLAANEFSP
jgi:hypothetical protein